MKALFAFNFTNQDKNRLNHLIKRVIEIKGEIMSKKKRRIWQRKKRATDNDYKENQIAAHKAWLERNPDYYKRYRESHEEYTKRNREAQKKRNKKRKLRLNMPDFVKLEIAKMDTSVKKNIIISGYYRLIPLNNNGIAKMDELIVKIEIISKG